MKLKPRLFIALILSLSLLSCSKKEDSATEKTLGKTLNIILKDNVRTVDPIKLNDVVGAEVANQIYETFLQYNYFKEFPELVTSLAESMPTLSKDGLKLTLKLRKGIRFQDDPCFKATQGKGRELTVHDFIYSWKRNADPKSESQGFWIFEETVVGMKEFRKHFDGKSSLEVMKEDVPGLKAIDNYTLEVTFTKPYPQFLFLLATTYTAPVPPEADIMYGKDLAHHPVGTGPFRVQSYNPTASILLVRNENYRDEFFPQPNMMDAKFKEYAVYSGKKLPLVDAIKLDVVKEEQPRWLNFLDGKYDMIQIPKDNFKAAVVSKSQVTDELKKKGIFVSVEPAFNFWYISFNMQDSVLGKTPYLRQAIASAIDQKQWLETFKNGRGEPQNEVSPPTMKDRCGSKYKYSYDLKRAKELLAKAGYPEGKGLPILKYETRNTDLSDRQLGEFIARSLAQIGIKVEVNANTFPMYLEKAQKGAIQFGKGGWILDYPDAENAYQLLYGPNKSPGPNEANYDNPEFNKLYEQLSLERNFAKRKAIMCKMEEILSRDMPCSYGIYEDEYKLAQGNLRNFHTAELIFTKWKYVDKIK